MAQDATGPRAMTVVDLIEMPELANAELSPTGGQVLFERSEADWEQNKRVSHLFLADADHGELRQLTYGESGETSGRFSPDGQTIAFLAKRNEDEHEQVHLLPVFGGEARKLFEHDTAPSNLAWLPTAPDSDSWLYFLASDPKDEKEKRRDELKDDVFAFDEDFKQRHLWRIKVDTLAGDNEAERLTEGAYSIVAFSFSRDGKTLLLHRAPTPLFDDSDETEIWSADAVAKDQRQVTHNMIREGRADLSPDGKIVLFTAGANESFEGYYNDNLFVVPVAGGTPELLFPEIPYGVQKAHWSKDGSKIFFLANTGLRSQLFEVDPGGSSYRALTDGDHSISGWDYRADLDLHLYSLKSPKNAGDLFRQDKAKATQVTHVFDSLEERFLLPRQERVSWQGQDGTEVEGLVFFPLDYVDGKRYPLAVQTHGGPASSDKFSFGRWNSYPQVLAARGWMVFKPNYRGSTGYGDEFLRDMVGHYFKNAHLDVMSGVDELIERGWVDPERMVKMGWSAGGHMTNKIITHTDRFKAASSGAGAANWISMYGQSDVRIYRTPWFGGTPWQKDAPIDVYWDNSPLKDVWKVTTPTLVLVGQNDERVPMPQSVELYRALKSNGVATKLYVAPREPHGFRELRHQLFKVNAELEWFEKHALGREYEWELAPLEDESAGSDKQAPAQTAEQSTGSRR